MAVSVLCRRCPAGERVKLGPTIGAAQSLWYCASRRTLGTMLHSDFGAVSYCGLVVLSARSSSQSALIWGTGAAH